MLEQTDKGIVASSPHIIQEVNIKDNTQNHFPQDKNIGFEIIEEYDKSFELKSNFDSIKFNLALLGIIIWINIYNNFSYS